jgi:hypothetical protein
MMETEIICAYACQEPFDNESKVPCVLKCGHTYCQSCIRQLVSKTCPACRRVFSGYTTNFALLDIISSNKKTTNNQDDLEKIFKDFETLKISHSIESYEKEISKILQNQSLENDYIATKIKLKFTVDDLDSKLFICALVKSVHRICLDPKNKLSESKFKRYASLLKIFISRNREFKLDALLALRANDNLRLIAKIFVEENVLNKNDINEFSNIVNIITQSSKVNKYIFRNFIKQNFYITIFFKLGLT